MQISDDLRNSIGPTVSAALREDIGQGDLTASLIDADAVVGATIIARESLRLAGQPWVDEVYAQLDDSVIVDWYVGDGESAEADDVICKLVGPARALLSGERTALNFLQTLSATATVSARYVKAVEGTGARILDTRKTLPGLRLAQKYAVTCGGGVNHRFALYDMIMLKDNHIDFCGGITQAITKTQQYLKDNELDLKIIVEARNLDEIAEILQTEGVYRILIDNFNYEDTRKAVDMIGDQCLTESSGGINEKTIREYARCGVDYISSGALTHSVYNLDLSLKAVE